MIIKTAGIVTSAAFLMGVAGCALQGPKREIASAPVCNGEQQCAAEWAAARTFVLNTAGFKLQTYSPDFMETYNPSEASPSLAAQVNKEPLPGGGYRIAAKFWCANIFSCIPNQWDTLDQFNRAVASIAQ